MNLRSSRLWHSVLTVFCMVLCAPTLPATNHNPAPSDPPTLSIPFSESSGAKYRKIALNGAPLSDEKPQQEAESDQVREETFIDALSLGLRHETTDAYVEVPASDLPLSVRRNVTSEIWNLRRGLRMSERLDRPFGAGWTSNLCATIQFVYRAESSEPNTATVTDENGAQYTFAIRYRTSVTYNTDIGFWGIGMDFLPVPSSRNDKDAYVCSLTQISGGQFVFTRKFGSTLTYDIPTEMVPRSSLQNTTDRFYVSDNISLTAYSRLLSVKDRFGNFLDYSYPATTTLIPSQIKVRRPDGLGAAITIETNAQGLVSTITDPRGKVTTYSYDSATYTDPYWPAAEDTYRLLSSVEAPDGGVTHYEYAFSTEADQTPNPDGKYVPPHLHVELEAITDPLGHKYEFSYVNDTTKFNYHSDAAGNYYQKTGLPRMVSEVGLPSGDRAYFFSDSRVALLYTGETPYPGFDGHRQTRVTDARGNRRTYDFTEAEVFVMEDFAGIYYGANEFDSPRMIFFKKMTVTHHNGLTEVLGTEVFDFNREAGMALDSATDFSGNVTLYEYNDEFTATVDQRNIAWGKFSDPTKEIKVLSSSISYEKSFGYKTNRIMSSITDPLGTVTRYRIDSESLPTGIPAGPHSTSPLANQYGRRLSETVINAQGVILSHLTYDFPDTYTASGVTYPPGLSKNFVTRKIVHKLASAAADPTWVASLVTHYVPDATGRVFKEIVDPAGLALTTEYTYDANGNKLTTKDPRGNTTTFGFFTFCCG